MTTTVIDLSVERSVMLNLGRVGENGVTEFVFDYANWTDEFGEGVLSLVLKRQGDAEGYPKSMTVESGQSTWVVDSTDVGVEGIGEAQLTYTVNGDAKKSVIYLTRTCPSIEPVGPAPDPYQSWLDQMIEAKEDAENAAERAETAAENLDTKGYYPDMHVGTADNLLSSSYQTDKAPYLLRRTPYGARERGSIVGGSIVWNQLLNPITWSGTTETGLTCAVGNDGITVNGTSNGSTNLNLDKTTVAFISGHVYALLGISGGSASTYRFIVTGYNEYLNEEKLFKPSVNRTEHYRLYVANGYTINQKFTPQIIDITRLFGPTIDDYIYAQEQATAGAGVALAKAWAGITADYSPYDAGSIKSVTGLTSHKMTGFNQFNIETSVVGETVNSVTGVIQTSEGRWRSEYIKAFPNTAYYACGLDLKENSFVAFYDDSKTYISRTSAGHLGYLSFTTPSNCRYMILTLFGIGGTDTRENVCLNFSNSSRNGQYEPYTAHTYPLDSSLTLRGILNLDGDSIYYDGDIYNADGTVERRYSLVVLDGSENWFTNSSNTGLYYVGSAKFTGIKTDGYILSDAFVPTSVAGASMTDGQMKIAGSNINFKTPYSTVAEWKTALSNKHVVVLYELSTPTTEQAEPYTALQICDTNGTEEWVGASMPVGHDTKYYADLKGKIEDIPDAPSASGTYVLKATVSSSGVTYSWVEG